MKYVYKQTGVVVESSIMLDSSLYAPYEEKASADAEKAEKTLKPAKTAKAAKKTGK